MVFAIFILRRLLSEQAARSLDYTGAITSRNRHEEGSRDNGNLLPRS